MKIQAICIYDEETGQEYWFGPDEDDLDTKKVRITIDSDGFAHIQLEEL